MMMSKLLSVNDGMKNGRLYKGAEPKFGITINNKNYLVKEQKSDWDNVLSEEDRNFEFKYATEYSPFSQDALKNWVHAWSKFKLVDMQYRELVKPDAIEMLKTYSVFLGEYLRLLSLGMYNYYWDNRGMEWVKC